MRRWFCAQLTFQYPNWDTMNETLNAIEVRKKKRDPDDNCLWVLFSTLRKRVFQDEFYREQERGQIVPPRNEIQHKTLKQPEGINLKRLGLRLCGSFSDQHTRNGLLHTSFSESNKEILLSFSLWAKRSGLKNRAELFKKMWDPMEKQQSKIEWGLLCLWLWTWWRKWGWGFFQERERDEEWDSMCAFMCMGGGSVRVWKKPMFQEINQTM